MSIYSRFIPDSKDPAWFQRLQVTIGFGIRGRKLGATVRSAAHMIANSAEMMIFLFLGVFTINDIHEWNWVFIICTIVCCLVFRVIGVLLLVAIANRFRIKKLDWLEQFIMMYGGLRGGVAFALVLTITEEVAPHAKMFVTATLAMVYFTVFVQGITIGPLVRLLKVK